MGNREIFGYLLRAGFLFFLIMITIEVHDRSIVRKKVNSIEVQ